MSVLLEWCSGSGIQIMSQFKSQWTILYAKYIDFDLGLRCEKCYDRFHVIRSIEQIYLPIIGIGQ